MITIIIAIFLAFMIAGAIADGLLSENAKQNPKIKTLLLFIPSPYNFMRLYAKAGDNLTDFTRAHAVSGMSYLGLMLIVGAFAFWADQQVLYGMEYVATLDHNFSLWQSVGIAIIIQAMLIFNGGSAMKLWVNGTLHDKNHFTQYKIHLLLASIALFSTLYLSFNTYSVAKARGLQAEQKAKDGSVSELDVTTLKFDKQISTLKAAYSADSIKILSHYTETIQTAISTFVSDSSRKALDVQRGINSQAVGAARIAHFRTVLQTAKSNATNKKFNAFAELDKSLGTQIKKLEGIKTETLDKWVAKVERLEDTTSEDVEFTAQNTRFKNLILNIIALFFNFGLQFYLKGANETEKAKKAAELAAAAANGGGSLGGGNNGSGGNNNLSGGNGGSSGNGGPVRRTNIVQTHSTGGTDPLDILHDNEDEKNIPPLGGNIKGGTLEANMGVIPRMLSGGQVVILYRAKNNDEFQGYSFWRGMLTTRINKYTQAKGRTSQANQLGWIRMIEQKLSYIEKHSTSGKSFQKRAAFDESKPNAEIFDKDYSNN